MKKNLLLGMAMALGLTTSINAQERFMDEIFTDAEITVVSDLTYGVNINFLSSDFSSDPTAAQLELAGLHAIAAVGNAYPRKWFIPNNPATPAGDSTYVKLSALALDVYMPIPGAVDPMAKRPVIFYAHTGSFLPKGINQQATGDKNDSAAVEFCKQWAKRGYVAVAVNYRLGWRPDGDLETRTGTLLNAVYRSVHDMKQAVRALKETATAGNGNPLYIDETKMVVFGQGSGGYTALAYGAMTNGSELDLVKFLDGQGKSYIDSTLVGNVQGFNGFLNLYQDSFSYSSDVDMIVNAGGALADISWIEAGEPAVVSIHCIRDAFAPFDTGTVIVPTTGDVVVDVNGPGTYMRKVNMLGNNDAFLNLWADDPYTVTARSRYGETYSYIQASKPTITIANDIDGTFGIEIPLAASEFQNTGAPWEWWSLTDLKALEAYYTSVGLGALMNADSVDAKSLFSNPNGHDKSVALAYIDTVQGYMHPRVMRVLQIGNWEILSVNEVKVNDVFSVYPNPANEIVTISSKGGNVNMVTIYDITGRMVHQELANVTTLNVNINELPKGIYVINVRTEKGENVEKLIIE